MVENNSEDMFSAEDYFNFSRSLLDIKTTQRSLYIDIDGYEPETLNIHMYDIFGQCIFSTQREILSGANKLNYNIRSKLSSGIYIVVVNGSKPIVAHKILIR